MNKISLGNDFTDDQSSDDSGKRVIKPADEAEGKEDPADALDSENQDDDSKDDSAVDDKGQDDSVEGAADDSKDDAADDSAAVDTADDVVLSEEDKKKQELTGLLDTEGKLDGDLGTIDEQISSAKQRIVEKRRARREGRELAGKVDEATPDLSETQDDLSDIDPDTIKVLERFTKARGLVPKSELSKMTYQQAHKSAEDTFYAAHPQYLPENDGDDVLYKALKKELTLYAAPSDAKLIPTLFEKAHDAVAKAHPDKFRKAVTVDKTKILGAAARVKSRQLGGGTSGGKGGGNSGSSGKQSGEGRQFDAAQIAALRSGGWSEDDIKELSSK